MTLLTPAALDQLNATLSDEDNARLADLLLALASDCDTCSASPGRD
jgi:hypothetical protein